MNACELTASISALANTIACQFTADELNILGVILIFCLISRTVSKRKHAHLSRRKP